MMIINLFLIGRLVQCVFCCNAYSAIKRGATGCNYSLNYSDKGNCQRFISVEEIRDNLDTQSQRLHRL